MYAHPQPAPGRLATAFRPLYLASLNKFYVDEFYEWLIVRPLRGIATLCYFLDDYLVHGLVRLTAWLPRLLGRRSWPRCRTA